MKPIIIDAEARAELDEAMEWYNDRQQGLGLELQHEVEAAISRIRVDAGIGARYRNTAYRFYRVKRFPYVLYYLDLPEAIWLVAIAHGRRRPGYWRKRTP
jgi:toxin ParE1/3/4